MDDMSKRAGTRLRVPARVSLGAAWLVLPAATGLALFFLAPILVFAVYSLLTPGFFSVSGPVTLDNYARAISFNPIVIGNTIVVGLLVAVITVVVSLPVAYWIRFSASRWQIPVLFVVTASVLASYLVRIYAWRTILAEKGLLNSILVGSGVVDRPLDLAFSRLGIVLALVHIFLPYVILVLYAGFRPIQPGHIAAAEDLGANEFTRWRRVILPLMAAPAVASFWFVLVLASSDYVTPQFLGSVSDVMIGVEIQANFRSSGNWPLGAASSFVVLAAFAVGYGMTLLGMRLLRLDRIHWSA
jgi:spermidine/putrescine transport system permease protein